jgi:AraC family transcriptional activator of tynA and feaB
MLQSDGVPGTPQLDYDAWREMLRSMCGRYNPEGVDPNAFAGWVRPVTGCGITALNIGCNAHRVERTCRDARLDGVDHYFAVFQVGGQSAMTHNDQAVRPAVGDVAFVDAARPVTYFADNKGATWNTVTLNLPRVGALFAPSGPWPVSRHADKLFARICGVIKGGFSDPDFGPVEVAAEAGISLRYLQKLFTERGSTWSEFIYSRRLDHAAHLLHRRALLGTGQPLSDIAYACGFRDYAHFARKFRHRFGYPPGAHQTWSKRQ